MKINKTVANYWLKYYTDEEGSCELCEDTGYITPFDPFWGNKMPCICPAGQHIRVDIECHICGNWHDPEDHF